MAEAKKERDTQSDMYQLTINNPKDYNMTHNRIKQILVLNFKTLCYFCMADEEGSCYHTHIFVCFTSRVRFSMMKKYFPAAHIEKVKGTVSENIAYIKKSGKWENDVKHGTQIKGTFEEDGQPPPDSRGKLADMTELYNMVVDGLTNAEIIARNQDYIMHIDKLDKLRTTLLVDKYKGTRRLDMKVTYIQGTTGSGKTRYVLDKHGDSNVYKVSDYKHPFDEYNCENVILFDEFRSSLSLQSMLDYLDIYPIQLVARYSNKYACYNRVYIVSNWSLQQQYSELQKIDSESWAAFLRRIHEVLVFGDGKIITCNSVNDFLNHDIEWHTATKEEQQEIDHIFK